MKREPRWVHNDGKYGIVVCDDPENGMVVQLARKIKGRIVVLQTQKVPFPTSGGAGELQSQVDRAVSVLKSAMAGRIEKERWIDGVYEKMSGIKIPPMAEDVPERVDGL